MATVTGWITQEKYILGWTPTQMEELLGVPRGYFSHGAIIWALKRFPEPNEFDLEGFTHWPGGQPVDGRRDLSLPQTLEFFSKHKGFARDSWSLTGPDRLVKIAPNQKPAQVDSWPGGEGVKPWRLLVEIEALEIPKGRLAASQPYLPYEVKY